jgi:asparagine synthase (glutamine-hydrolysing)
MLEIRMIHYIALVPSLGNVERHRTIEIMIARIQAKDHSWNFAWLADGSCIAYRSSSLTPRLAHNLPGRLGLVLGRVFTKPSVESPSREEFTLDDPAAHSILQSNGEYLIQERWGQYVGFFVDLEHASHSVVRDPSGQIPCFHTTLNGLQIVFSDVEDLDRIGLPITSLNWRYIAGFLLNNHLQIEETGFDGVKELQPGARLTFGGAGQSIKYIWNLTQFARCDPHVSFQEVQESVVSTLQQCTDVVMSCYRRVVHRLSGGLDSAVVLDALMHAPSKPVLFCENHFSSAAPEGDERVYARKIAAALGCALRETEFDPTAGTLHRLTDIPRTAKPSMSLLSFQHTYIREMAREYSIDAFTNGHGGDQLFCQYSGPLIAADYAIRNGIDSELGLLIRSIAHRNVLSRFSVIAAIARYAYARRRYDVLGPFITKHPLLTPSARDAVSADYLMSVWLRQTRGIPPAKLLHMYFIADLQVYNEPSIETYAADTPHMLGVQPLVELCLRTPTYYLSRGGIDRAMEREAFASRLPPEVVDRRLKGSTTRYFNCLLLANLKWLRPFLLDGMVARSGLIDRKALDSMLRTDYLIRHHVSESLTSCLAAEAWTQASCRQLSARAA